LQLVCSGSFPFQATPNSTTPYNLQNRPPEAEVHRLTYKLQIKQKLPQGCLNIPNSSGAFASFLFYEFGWLPLEALLALKAAKVVRFALIGDLKFSRVFV
jgi:hypothetical protein